ncbi:MAG: HEAT repeat domain-containing protein [Candidatus Hydrogenedentes bacterium]|nr:HEAT repeat domain-containing protein [Candidatus Hydrogenedentota bacterium]
MRHCDRYDSDTTPSRVVAERYRAAIGEDKSKASLALIHYRGGQEEFDLGVEYAKSPDPLERVTGADILAQLGWDDRTFLDESVRALLSMLDDANDEALSAAAIALGHRGDPRSIPALVCLSEHPNADVRYGVVFGLLSHSQPDAIRAMIALARDPDLGVRNWATFGLGSQVEDDTSEIRAALRANLTDTDHEIRGEAIVGLANRKEPDIIDILIREWESSDVVSVLSLEAAETAADARLVRYLERFRTDLSLDDDSYFRSVLEDAIKACNGEPEPETEGDARRIAPG